MARYLKVSRTATLKPTLAIALALTIVQSASAASLGDFSQLLSVEKAEQSVADDPESVKVQFHLLVALSRSDNFERTLVVFHHLLVFLKRDDRLTEFNELKADLRSKSTKVPGDYATMYELAWIDLVSTELVKHSARTTQILDFKNPVSEQPPKSDDITRRTIQSLFEQSRHSFLQMKDDVWSGLWAAEIDCQLKRFEEARPALLELATQRPDLKAPKFLLQSIDFQTGAKPSKPQTLPPLLLENERNPS
jgi:hypothetical protein